MFFFNKFPTKYKKMCSEPVEGAIVNTMILE